MDDLHVSWVFLIPIVSIIGSFTYVIVLTLSRARVRELEVRERIAMIERGMVPAPEVDPRGFDRAMNRLAAGFALRDGATRVTREPASFRPEDAGWHCCSLVVLPTCLVRGLFEFRFKLERSIMSWMPSAGPGVAARWMSDR